MRMTSQNAQKNFELASNCNDLHEGLRTHLEVLIKIDICCLCIY